MSGRTRRPSWLLALLALLTFGCNASIDGLHGGGRPDPGSGGSGAADGGSGGAPATGGSTGAGGAITCGASALPAEVQGFLQLRCQPCHGNPPLPTVPGSLMTVDDFARPAKSNPALTMAEASLMRVTTTDAKLRMPPVPATPLTTAEIQTLQRWIGDGMPPAACQPGAADGGASADAGVAPDPFAVPARCTSGTTWTGGLRESPLMQPGEPCVACHQKGEAPRLAFGGTVYPSAHEPSQCYGANGTASAQGAEVMLVDAAGLTFTATVTAAGNFFVRATAPLTPPLRTKVAFLGRERVMIAAVPDGDCNACHTQKGTTTVTTPGSLPAPGRIILP